MSFCPSRREIFLLQIQKRCNMHGITISNKYKINNIINRKRKGQQILLLHVKKPPSEYSKKIFVVSHLSQIKMLVTKVKSTHKKSIEKVLNTSERFIYYRNNK